MNLLPSLYLFPAPFARPREWLLEAQKSRRTFAGWRVCYEHSRPRPADTSGEEAARRSVRWQQEVLKHHNEARAKGAHRWAHWAEGGSLNCGNLMWISQITLAGNSCFVLFSRCKHLPRFICYCFMRFSFSCLSLSLLENIFPPTLNEGMCPSYLRPFIIVILISSLCSQFIPVPAASWPQRLW